MCCCLIQYELKPKDAVMGSALHIPLPADLKLGSSISVKVTYKTTKDCTALQWLEKEYVRQIEIGVGHDLRWIYSDKRKERLSHICSASVNPSMPERWRHYKVITHTLFGVLRPLISPQTPHRSR
jgi:hypothetical protein